MHQRDKSEGVTVLSLLSQFMAPVRLYDIHFFLDFNVINFSTSWILSQNICKCIDFH